MDRVQPTISTRLVTREQPVVKAIVFAVAVVAVSAAPVGAAPRCTAKSAAGTGPTEDVARFQVYEGLLKSVDNGLWLSWLATGKTTGYKVGKPTYTCRGGVGLGVTCTGRTVVCSA
jgi:hypothetical protein